MDIWTDIYLIIWRLHFTNLLMCVSLYCYWYLKWMINIYVIYKQFLMACRKILWIDNIFEFEDCIYLMYVYLIFTDKLIRVILCIALHENITSNILWQFWKGICSSYGIFYYIQLILSIYILLHFYWNINLLHIEIYKAIY